VAAREVSAAARSKLPLGHSRQQPASCKLLARTFDVPRFYRGDTITKIKEARRVMDPRKRDLAPTVLDFGPVRFKLARHFGFCYGVENAIDIAYRAVEENPERRVFLLSEMIHNPHVNADLRARGVDFLRTTTGEELIPLDTLTPDDVVIIPAFGATLEIMDRLRAQGVDPMLYNTTCPFVEKVWKKSAQIGTKGFTVVVHGKRIHEETRATFSHAKEDAPVVVVRDLDEARLLGDVILGRRDRAFFFDHFGDRASEGFDPARDLGRIGVVNQTTMLATETQAIAAYLRDVMVERYGPEAIGTHFADTSDTLCYATNENQNATLALIESGGDVALIVGGYNSSNTSHLVELCARAMPTYFIASADEIVSPECIRHFDYDTKTLLETTGWMPEARPFDVVLTAGASCPDALLEAVVEKVVSWVPGARTLAEVAAPILN
jgi:4-hydroxy-3-methylbut-2-en-1-yl diphosphate reductase